MPTERGKENVCYISFSHSFLVLNFLRIDDSFIVFIFFFSVPDTKVCKYGEVLCTDRKTCAKVCDGVPQCDDGVDEEFACD